MDCTKENEIIIKKYKKPKFNVIFLHGFISSKDIFKEIYEKINIKKVNYYSFDYSTKIINNKQKLILEDFVEQLIKFINYYNLDNIILVGHSMGGAVVALSYQKIKEKIKKIILISPLSKAIIFSKASITFLRGIARNDPNIIKRTLFSHENKNLVTTIDDILIRDYNNFLKNKHIHIELGISLILLSKLNKIMNEYKQIQCETLILLGKKDIVIPGDYANNEFKKMNKSNFNIHLLDNFGHTCWLENFKIFENFFKSFINK